MNSNSKTLSNSIKKDLYLQACKLKENPIDSEAESQLNELIDSLKTSEIVQYVEQQREWLQKLFQAWRLQTAKTYDVYQVANFIETKRIKRLKMLFIHWHTNIEQIQIRQVMLFRFQNKRDKRIKGILMKAWNQVVSNLQQKQIQKYDAQQLYTKNTKRLYFHQWCKFIQRTQNDLVAYQELIHKQKLKLYQKYFGIMKFKLHQTENYLEQYAINKQKQRLLAIFQFWSQYVDYTINQKQQVKEFIKKRNLTLMSEMLTFLNTRAQKNMIYRRQKTLAQYGRWKMLMQKSFSTLLKYKVRQQSKRYLQAIRKDNLEKLAIQTLRDTKNLIQKYKEIQKILNEKKVKQIFFQLQNYTQKQKYKRYSLEFAELFRCKSLQKQLFSLLQLYHNYKIKKRDMNEKMMQVHLVKFCKNILKKWKQYNQQIHHEKLIKQQIEFSSQYRIKKQIFKIMSKDQ
ncbi:unnamed protein product (macronuclear) [Paramecium tetraurelia]|uniref:Sfi1 spindle body domain-containing protein n=1 Tax=Paramecium tetraurelia TaxID=5888 RepID=A0BGL7_PARTE|nr:uncharacterized protein GSPATT00028719001 [Paramecium tetraurelia]CAK57684.1 unnamed protein product [Paramecium tetraurelia]|eukprot:XP_001425082.1 hypothetical protein (macronuclear) [Paramecium tetraurelia strain d4-2]